MSVLWHRVEGCTTRLGNLAELYYGDWRLWRYIWSHNEDLLVGIPLHAPLPAGMYLCIPHHSRMSVPIQEALPDEFAGEVLTGG